MDMNVFHNKQELDQACAAIIIATVQQNPEAVLGLATGETPRGTYQELIKAYRQGLVSFQSVTSFNLDEYVGLPQHHPNSYFTYMNNHLFTCIDIPRERTHIPNGFCTDLEEECHQYDLKLQAAGQIDLQILGIGINGHIGFNEPYSNICNKTHLVSLSQETRLQNAKYFEHPDEIPIHALTMGIGSILQAKTIVLIASGATKSYMLERALKGPITTEIPASLLQLHSHVIVMMDAEAGRWVRP